MNRNLLLFTFIATALPFASFAQKNVPANVVTTNKTIYDKAIEYGDLNTAIVAAHTILANSPNDYHYMDSLVGLYYDAGNLVAAINIGNDILAAAPQNVAVREVVANSQLALGLNGEAMLNYQDLYTRTGYLVYLYNIATTQFSMKNFTECTTTIDSILASDKNMTEVVIINADGQSEPVALKAAAYNIKGAIAMELNNAAIAKQNFEEALKVAPNFTLAKKNLEAVTKK